MKYLFAFIILMSLAGCRKDIPVPQLEPELGLTETLEGTYTGIMYENVDQVYCATCNPPCTWSYTYDTAFVQVDILRLNEDSIRVIGVDVGYYDRELPIDSNLYYSGWPPYSTPDGHYILNFRGSNNDSLIIDLRYGGGDPCGGSWTTRRYYLLKQ